MSAGLPVNDRKICAYAYDLSFVHFRFESGKRFSASRRIHNCPQIMFRLNAHISAMSVFTTSEDFFVSRRAGLPDCLPNSMPTWSGACSAAACMADPSAHVTPLPVATAGLLAAAKRPVSVSPAPSEAGISLPFSAAIAGKHVRIDLPRPSKCNRIVVAVFFAPHCTGPCAVLFYSEWLSASLLYSVWLFAALLCSTRLLSLLLFCAGLLV